MQAGEITGLLRGLKNGEPDASARLIPLVYGDLRNLARRYLALERKGHTLQPTALVHECYLRLIDQAGIDWRDRAHFFAVAAKVMRQVLIDYARSRKAAKRGGLLPRATLDENMVVSESTCGDFIELDDALNRLETLDPRQAKVVELKFFGGLSPQEIGEVLGVSIRTVKRDWRLARAWLYGELCER